MVAPRTNRPPVMSGLNPLKTRIWKWVAVLGLPLFPIQPKAAATQFVEIAADIETYGYRLGDTNSIADAKPKTVSVVCILGTNQWYIENDFQQREQWLFDGTNVVRTIIPQKAIRNCGKRVGSRATDIRWGISG